MDLDCVDATGTDETMLTFRQRLPGAIPMNSVGQFVRSVENRLGAGSLNRLRIFGHGGSGVQVLGGGRRPPHWYNVIQVVGDSVTGADELQRLKSRFAARGWAELHGCSVAHGEPGRQLLTRLAHLWGVPVAGGTVIQNTGAGFEWRYAVASPNGRLIYRDGRQPEAPSNDDWVGLPLLYLSPIVGAGFVIGAAIRQVRDAMR